MNKNNILYNFNTLTIQLRKTEEKSTDFPNNTKQEKTVNIDFPENEENAVCNL